jgi:Abnormal spindle-like microcephaly-assoc'd, ASPM-SPD-2-Hydin
MASLASRPFVSVCLALVLGALLSPLAGCGSDGKGTPSPDGAIFAEATLAISPSFLDFGDVPPGSAGPMQKFTVTNIGMVRTGPVNFALDGTDAAAFVVMGSTCGATVSPGESCELRLALMPKDAGRKSARLYVAAMPGTTASAALTGSGQAAAAVAMSPALFDFPPALALEVTGGQAAIMYPRATFTIKNGSATPVGPFNLAIEGKDAADFAVAENSCGARVTVESGCTIVVRFRPEKIGAKTAMLTVAADGVKLTAALQGFGSDRAMLAVTPDTQQFGAVPVGMKSANIFTIENKGGAATGKLAQSIVGLNVSDFQVTASSCPEALAPGESCTVTVTFAPLTAGTKAAVLHLDATPGGSAAVSMQATGIAASVLSAITVTPTADPPFGDVPVGAQSAAVFVIENKGVAQAGKPTFTILGPNATEFVVTGDNCPAALDPSATCTVNVAFTPATTGARTASLQVSASPGGYASAALTGNGIKGAALGIRATTKDYGRIYVGQQSSVTEFTVTNNGPVSSGALAVTLEGADAGNFVVVVNECHGQLLASNASCHISVRFVPLTLGAKITTLVVTGTPGGVVRSTLTGTGRN